MIPQPFIFSAETINECLTIYTNLMPVHLNEFEREHGPGIVKLINIVPCEHGFCAIATIWQDKARMEAIEASKKITEGGADLISQLSSRLTQAFNAEGCDHEYDSDFDEDGNEKIVCKKCKTPLA